MTVLLGVDLSATCTAAIAVPLDWGGDWRRVAWTKAGSKLHRDSTDSERALRTESIGIALATFAKDRGVSQAFLESYAFGQDTAAHTLGEIGGVVRLYLLQTGVELHTSQMGTARKLLLGSVPTKQTLPEGTTIKDVILRTLQDSGAPFFGEEYYDVADAFVAANFGLSELGGLALVQAPVVAPAVARERKPRNPPIRRRKTEARP